MTELPRVLIVDASRVIRASLAKYLKEFFDVREETNGESAWQTLVLDSSIVAVVSGVHLTKLDGYGLVERMRANKLRRLRSMPFYLIVSDVVGEGERQQGRVRGITGFLQKGMGSAEIGQLISSIQNSEAAAEADEESLAAPDSGGQLRAGSAAEEESVGTTSYSGAQSDIGVSDILGQMGRLAGLSGAISGEEAATRPAEPGKPEFPLRQEVEARLQELLPAVGSGQAVGVLIFGLDSYAAVSQRFNRELADKIALKFGRLLVNKIRTEDSIGHYGPGRIAIVAPGTNRALCASFAERVCKSLAAAQISIRGQRVDMTVSVGIATMPEDGIAMEPGELLTLADGRLESAVRQGGNRVESGTAASGEDFRQGEFIAKLKELMSSLPPEAMQPCLGSLGLQIVPVLKQMELSFHFGLPLEEIERRLWARARAERMNS